MTGVRFGPPNLDGLLADPGTVFWSTPVLAAILAAGTVRSGAGLAMLTAIQHAHYVDGRRVVEAPVLRALAEASGLDAAGFDRAPARVSASDHIAASRGLMDGRARGDFRRSWSRGTIVSAASITSDSTASRRFRRCRDGDRVSGPRPSVRSGATFGPRGERDVHAHRRGSARVA